MDTLITSKGEENEELSSAENQKEIDPREIYEINYKEATKYYFQSANYYEVGDFEKASQIRIKADEHLSVANLARKKM